MKLKFTKTHKDAVTPTYAKEGDAGLDLTAIGILWSAGFGYVEFETGIAVEIPKGYVGLLFPRSSLSKYKMRLCNSVGVVDSGYRGTIKLRFRMDDANGLPTLKYKLGDKIAQLVIMPCPTIELEEVEELSTTGRGVEGFGSSGE